ncbi:HNH endonuclease signature motif containing protein [soil metagenome]
MSTSATSLADAGADPKHRLEVLFDELAELTGHRNAIDARIVQIIAEVDHNRLWGNTGARSVAALVAWKTGVSPTRAKTIAAVAHRLQEFPRCAQAMAQGRVSLDQIGVLAQHAAPGSDAHYAQLIDTATVTQLRTAIALEPPPEPDTKPEPEPRPRPEPPRSITKTTDHQSTTWHITLPHHDAAEFDAALTSHQDALVAAWKRDHADTPSETTPPFPTPVDGLLSLIRAGWDTDVAARPHGHRTTAVIHVDLDTRVSALHLGPLLSDDDRQYLLCDTTCEVWFERDGHVLGAGRETRTIHRRLRRALEHLYHFTCVVPCCGATRGLHAHHLTHWEDGGPTELSNLVLICPFHHRQHHRGVVTLTGPAENLTVTDTTGRQLTTQSLARPPTTPPPDVPPCPGPTGERADWWWYQPFQPPPTD